MLLGIGSTYLVIHSIQTYSNNYISYPYQRKKCNNIPSYSPQTIFNYLITPISN